LHQLRNLFFTKQSNHRTWTVLFYIFDILYHDGSALAALPFVAAARMIAKNGEMYVFSPTF